MTTYAKTCHSFDVRATTFALAPPLLEPEPVLHSAPIQDTPISPAETEHPVNKVQYAFSSFTELRHLEKV